MAGGRIKNQAKDLIKDFEDIVYPDFGTLRSNLDDRSYLVLELGMGKGGFISEYASRNQDSFFVGVESKEERVLSASKKVKEKGIGNVVFCCSNFFKDIEDYDGLKVDELWINFPDPWPKKRHIKRRFINERTVELIFSLLKEDGKLFFRTDWDGLFEFTLEVLRDFNCEIEFETNDLYSTDFEPKITTEFEQKFLKNGENINLLVAKNEK